MRIFNRGRTDGFILLDAILAIALVGILLYAAIPGLRFASRRSGQYLTQSRMLIEERNRNAAIRMGISR